MRRAVVLLVALVALAVPSVAAAENGQQTTLLLTPSGQPVGGVWQRWLNDSYMPTYSGSMVLTVSAGGVCGTVSGAIGCTNGTLQNPVSAVTPGSPAQERQTLLYEQGHVVDFEYLTDSERLELIALWGRHLPSGDTVQQYWWQGESNYWGQPVMGEWFADDYSLCALHHHWTWGLLDHASWTDADSYPLYSDFRQVTLVESGKPKDWRNELLPPTRSETRWLQAQEESCSLIRYWITAATGSTAGT